MRSPNRHPPPPCHHFIPAELEVVKGSDLVGLKYEPMFKYFANREQSFVVCEDNYVTNESGTGIVHQVCVCASVTCYDNMGLSCV